MTHHLKWFQTIHLIPQLVSLMVKMLGSAKEKLSDFLKDLPMDNLMEQNLAHLSVVLLDFEKEKLSDPQMDSMWNLLAIAMDLMLAPRSE